MKAKRRTSTEESQKYWSAVDKIVKSSDDRQRRIPVGEPWTDSRRDISASLSYPSRKYAHSSGNPTDAEIEERYRLLFGPRGVESSKDHGARESILLERKAVEGAVYHCNATAKLVGTLSDDVFNLHCCMLARGLSQAVLFWHVVRNIGLRYCALRMEPPSIKDVYRDMTGGDKV